MSETALMEGILVGLLFLGVIGILRLVVIGIGKFLFPASAQRHRDLDDIGPLVRASRKDRRK